MKPNIGTLTDGLNYYILSSSDWQQTISLILSLNYSIEGNEMVGNTETVLSLLDSINYYTDPTIVQGMVVYESADLNYNVSSTISNGIVYDEILSVYIPYVTTKVSDIELDTYTVTFKDWNGTTLKSQSTSYGGSVTPPTNPTRTGYTFTGWDDNSYTYVESDLTITAQYTANPYTVYFNAGGNTPTNANL